MADFGTLARPYARAIFDIAQSAGELDQWSASLAAAANVVDESAARAYLGRPELHDTDRAQFVAAICADVPGAAMFATPQGANLLGLLSENNRLVVLSEISKQFDQLKMQAEQKVNVTITSATALDHGQATALIESLQRKLGRKVELEQRVDEALVGGAVIQADDMVIDGSVRSRLQRLTESLLD